MQALVKEHLFEQAPIMIALLDSECHVVAGNASFRRTFPEWAHQRCYQLFKNSMRRCPSCVALKTLQDAKVRVHEEIIAKDGVEPTQYVVRVARLGPSDTSPPALIMWMASEVTEAVSLLKENELLFERVPCYVTVLDRNLRIVRSNRKMKETFGGRKGEHCYRVYKRRDSPCPGCATLMVFRDGADHTASQVGVSATGEEVHYIESSSALVREGGGRVNRVIQMSTDVTNLHLLEKEKIEAERMAAVGQTVAGLAHGIKNILMGVEGGVYVLQSGLRQNNPARLDTGVEMLSRNVEKISALVKNLLSFSKGTVPHVTLTDPNKVAREILELYGQTARKAGIELRAEQQEGVEPAALDAEGIHTCLANLVSNAIDACQWSEKKGCRVTLKTSEENGVLCFEVADDGCGMDYDVKKKIFTTFFTTKGSGGTGLGLLLTRKIVQEHGGKILVDSEPERGTTFRILLPRNRLPRPTGDSGIGGEGGSAGAGA
ncbi:MAG: ATP-binding protein [Acidobacteriota bacterium]